jgi:hypothetical protein
MGLIKALVRAGQLAALRASLEAVEQEVGRMFDVPTEPSKPDVNGVIDAQFVPDNFMPLRGTRAERIYTAALLGAQTELRMAVQRFHMPDVSPFEMVIDRLSRYAEMVHGVQPPRRETPHHPHDCTRGGVFN